MDQTEGLKRVDNHIGGRAGFKRYVGNKLAVAAVNAGKNVAICQREGIISLKPFGDYVEIKFSEYEKPTPLKIEVDGLPYSEQEK